MSFLDELEQRPRASRSRSGKPERRRARTHPTARRRAVAGAVLVVVLIALAFGIGSLRDSARLDSFRSYARAAAQIASVSNRQGASLIAALSSGSSAGSVQAESELNGVADDASALAQRARGLARPDELAGVQTDLLEVVGFRHDAFEKIARLLPTALGDTDSSGATGGIASAMQELLASDVILSNRVGPDLRAELRRQGLSAPSGLIHGRSLSDVSWLSPSYVGARVAALRPTAAPPASSGSTAAAPAGG